MKYFSSGGLVGVSSITTAAIFLLSLSVAQGFIGFSSRVDSLTVPPPPHLHGKTIYVFWSKEKGYEVKVGNGGMSWLLSVSYLCSYL